MLISEPAPDRVRWAWGIAREALLNELTPSGHWAGQLSTSALSTATAVLALELVQRAVHSESGAPADEERFAGESHGDSANTSAAEGTSLPQPIPFHSLIEGGLRWIAEHQNADGGWGDTDKSVSNISTTMLCHAVFHGTGTVSRYQSIVDRGTAYIAKAGGVPALRARYGSDRTFSVPILTHCALAGQVDWSEVSALPFELACVPHRFYKWMQLPVVSYALPALIAIGQVRHHHKRPWFPPWRWLRDKAVEPSLKKLDSIQPTSGGFLEATPLTSFVTMSLAGKGLARHPVAQRGVQFLVDSVRPDGSWPIDTNLATWVTTLAINALGDQLPRECVPRLAEWLLGQQYRVIHPYTQANPGAWAWTDLSGGVPDADDTPGALLALSVLEKLGAQGDITGAYERAATWLLDLQNRDSGWPTFCRGWGTLPFDRSSADITAHAVRALEVFSRRHDSLSFDDPRTYKRHLGPLTRARHGIFDGMRYLESRQRKDGSWLPLWFGNQHAPHDENPTYGTAKVLMAFRDVGCGRTAAARLGVEWLFVNQNPDGGWGAGPGTPSSVEETSLALEALLDQRMWPSGSPPSVVLGSSAVRRGLRWLVEAVDNGTFCNPSPIGFYFAKLWYYEKLYPTIFAVGAMRRAVTLLNLADAE